MEVVFYWELGEVVAEVLPLVAANHLGDDYSVGIEVEPLHRKVGLDPQRKTCSKYCLVRVGG